VAVHPLVWRRYTGLAVDIGAALGAHGDATPVRAPLSRALDDEAGLVAAVARGEPTALQLAYERHSRGVYSLALRLLGDGAAAEEVVQETFLKLWRHPGSFEPNRGRLFTWLLGVAHHHAVDLLRRRQLEQRHRAPTSADGDGLVELLENHSLASADDDPQSRVGNLEQRLVLERALARLSREQRLPLELAYYRGMTQVEIAARLGEPLGTIKTRMRLALQQLRKAPELSDLWRER
jgi:RNA polymerase sigma-70 factor (ECF subfamily)